jgi:NAD+ kinase
VTSKVGLYLRPNLDAVRDTAERLAVVLRARGCEVWSASAWDGAATARYMPGTELLVCIGGDGTVLRGARASIPHPVNILAVNVGRLGFLSEVTPEEAEGAVLSVLDGAGRIEERSMIEGIICHPGGDEPAVSLPLQYALNDIVVGRYAPGRPVYITATGSTGYSLSAGGPVLFPESRELLITPVAAHLSRVRPLVLPDGLSVELRVETDHRAVVSFDGQLDEELGDGACVRIRRAPHVARLVRLRPPTDFYRKLIRHLDEPTVPPEYPDRIPSPES